MGSLVNPPPCFTLVRLAACGLVVALGLTAVAPGQDRTVPRVGPSAGPRPETLSSSSQFLAHGPVREDRSKLVSEAERVRAEVALLLDREEKRSEPGFDYGVPTLPAAAKSLTIHLWLQGDAQPPLQPRVYRLEGAVEPTLGLVIARARLAEGEGFRREIVRLLLAERIMRVHPETDLAPRAEIVPPWLLTGVTGALDHLRLGSPGARFAAVFEAGQVMPLGEILATQPGKLDGASREIFAASACCLVLALLEQPDGPARFRAFLGEIPVRSDGPQSQLVRSFPGLALSKHSLEKWWSLQMAQMAQPTAFEPLGAVETDERLTAALLVRVRPDVPRPEGSSAVGRWLKHLLPGAKEVASHPVPTAPPGQGPVASPPVDEVIPLTEIDRLLKLPERGKILAANQAELSLLALRAFPLHRPLLDEYQQILGLIVRGKTRGLPPRIEALAARRRGILSSVEQVEDHLNWYQATQRRELSGDFESYFKLLDDLAKTPPKSDDPITRYLDEIEREFESR